MKKTNNKGFSLVELIIVIAIMAILIGVLAPQYIKYVERSRVSADKDVLDSIYTACTTAAADATITDAPTNNTAVDITSGSWGSEVMNTLGITTTADLKFKSKTAKNGFTVGVDSMGNFSVMVSGTEGSFAVPEK